MLNQFFRTPFASAGDKTAVPEATQPDGSVSYNQGWSPDYELPYSNASSKDIPRDKSNQLAFAITKALQEYQTNGVPDWIDPTQNGGVNFPYPLGARVRYIDGLIYISAKAANSSLPSVAADWFPQGSGVYASNTVYLQGSGNFTVPQGVYAMDVQGWGGGGAAGGNGSTANGSSSGGGSGGYGRVRVSVTPGQVIAYVVGAGGNATIPSSGGTTSFGVFLTVNGGGAGPGNAIGIGGAPAAIGSGGTTYQSGGNTGEAGLGSGSGPGGMGGAAPFGGGGGAAAPGAPGPGSIPGGGGGGRGSTSTGNGGNGGPGLIIINY